jgi:hypothetical protein
VSGRSAHHFPLGAVVFARLHLSALRAIGVVSAAARLAMKPHFHASLPSCWTLWRPGWQLAGVRLRTVVRLAGALHCLRRWYAALPAIYCTSYAVLLVTTHHLQSGPHQQSAALKCSVRRFTISIIRTSYRLQAESCFADLAENSTSFSVRYTRPARS